MSKWVAITCKQCKSVKALGWEYVTFNSQYWIKAAQTGTARSDIHKYTEVIDVEAHKLEGLCYECSIKNKKETRQ
tara:strand:+ start:189 stop:413 length:225 start_codon:yes stop_codon:yes gene_type:complete